MNVNEVLQFVDRLVVEKMGRHLNDVEKAVVEGTWQRQSYNDIAEKCHITEGHAGDIASELWQLLSEALGEDIKKSNFRSTLERISIGESQNPNICIANNNYFFGSQIINEPLRKSKESDTNTKSQSSYHDLTLAPKIIKFYNRETELKTLSNWILNQNTPLISVLGRSGIGKSYLVRRFIDLNLEQFEVIIWRSLKYPESSDLLIDDLLNISQKNIKPNNHNKLKQLFDIFRDKQCLIILDDVDNIFINSQLAGQYKTEYQDYQNFFTKIIETENQSHVILISQEKCKEMECLDEELYPVKCLELSGLAHVEILRDMGLKDENLWLNLINLYEGNPFYIKNIANSIKNVFDGYVGEFLAENELVIPKDIQTNLQLLFNRLSPIEQKIVIKLSDSEQLVSREDLKTSLDLSSTDLINSLESLQHRYLVTKITGDKIRFKLSNVFKEYMKNCSKNSC
ncbi:NB-ARC domain-containing protein [Planktothrix sp. FACHB-1365]|uniref:NB-ARC domain-containing protein n=1 Tax=Planktothrix sp. FACHB-1365 TaxID=2692855 RepID=UPI0016850ED5|nr:NB-ARC domain-containing protein [Planktothrix sp. FACHB-1365]MBD2483003.1 AAA family ATPase [Planktothrix sp. FACHB-1365]